MDKLNQLISLNPISRTKTAPDIGFVEGEIDEPLLVQIPVAIDQLILVVANSHQLASLKSIELDHLRGARTPNLRERSAQARRQPSHAQRHHGIADQRGREKRCRSWRRSDGDLQACRSGQAFSGDASRASSSVLRSPLPRVAPRRPPPWPRRIRSPRHDEADSWSVNGHQRCPNGSIDISCQTDKMNQFHK